jgi:hypothetical protein
MHYLARRDPLLRLIHYDNAAGSQNCFGSLSYVSPDWRQHLLAS